MIRYLFFLLTTLVAAYSVQAQMSSDQWTIYPIIDSRYDKIIDTDSKVYFLSSGSLYSFDKSSNETYFYNSSNKLSGSSIEKIFYNAEGKYLIIVYTDSNIDMLYDDGRCYCLPDIKDATVVDDKTVNDVAFGNGRFVVATNFGLVIYDDNKREVVESGVYRQAIESVAVCGDYILIYSPYSLKYSKMTDRHNKYDVFVQLKGMYTDFLNDIGDNGLAWVNKNNNTLMFTTIDFETKQYKDNSIDVKVDSPISKWSGGFYFKSGDKVLLFDNEGAKVDEFSLNDVLNDSEFGLWKGKASVWFGNNQGNANFDMSSSTPVVLSDWYRPEAATCGSVAYFYTSPDGERIYVGNLGPTNNRTYLAHYINDSDGKTIRQKTDLIENGHISDVSIIEASAKSTFAKNAQLANNDKGMYGGVTRLAEDPNDAGTYFIGNGLEGLYVVKDREEVWKFNVENSPFDSYWETRVFDVNFDPQGNLWVGHAHNNKEHAPYIILPAAKLRKGYENIKENDWVRPDLLNFNPFTKDFISYFCQKSRYAFFINGAGYEGFYVLNTKGTYDNVKDDVCYGFSVVVDQDGNTLQPGYYYCVAEDQLGRVWMGTSQGLFYFNASSGIDDNSTVVRPKVPRNDGTNYADFLLDSDQINSIAVDHSNRKWIATDLSGVYLVSENGDRIISHFDTSNSPLPSNRVTAVACDKNNSTVYFGTTDGLFAYKSDSSPANEDFSEIYAYPNPVRPDYTGVVTITGLMDNSLVKIADTSGNVFYQGRSEGGMVTWNGCNQSGERVKSGIYYVYASSGTDGQNTAGVVTKIMVIN